MKVVYLLVIPDEEEKYVILRNGKTNEFELPILETAKHSQDVTEEEQYATKLLKAITEKLELGEKSAMKLEEDTILFVGQIDELKFTDEIIKSNDYKMYIIPAEKLKQSLSSKNVKIEETTRNIFEMIFSEDNEEEIEQESETPKGDEFDFVETVELILERLMTIETHMKEIDEKIKKLSKQHKAIFEKLNSQNNEERGKEDV